MASNTAATPAILIIHQALAEVKTMYPWTFRILPLLGENGSYSFGTIKGTFIIPIKIESNKEVFVTETINLLN